MSIGQGVGAVAGVALAFAFPAVVPLAGTIGMLPAGLLFGAMAGGMAEGLFAGGIKSPMTEGQRLQAMAVQSSSYGVTIPKIFGRMRTAGNLIWLRPVQSGDSNPIAGIVEEREEQVVQTGGGGKVGGGASSSQVYYRYYGTFAVGICAGIMDGVIKIWADSKLIYNIDTTGLTEQQINDTRLAALQIPVTFYSGTETQAVDPVMSGFDGVPNTPAYRGMAYAVFNRLPLADYGNRIPNLTFEVARAGGIDSRMSLLLPFDSDTTTEDQSAYGNVMTNSGAVISTTQKKFGTGSAYFNGAASLTTPTTGSQFNFSSTDFTIDFWIRQTAISNGVIFNFGDDLDRRFYCQIFGGKLRIGFATAGVYSVYDGANTIALNTDYHIAIVRTGGVYRVSLNGNLEILFSPYTLPAYIGQLCLGGDSSGGGTSPFTGHIDEFRIATYALWTTNFTPPEAGITTGGGVPTPEEPIKLMFNCEGLEGTTSIEDTSTFARVGAGENGANILNSGHLMPGPAFTEVAVNPFMGAGFLGIINPTSRVIVPASTDFDWNTTAQQNFEVSFAVLFGTHDGVNDYVFLSTGGSSYRTNGWTIRCKKIAGDHTWIVRHTTGIGVDSVFEIVQTFSNPVWIKVRLSYDAYTNKARLYLGSGPDPESVYGGAGGVSVNAIINSTRNLTIGAEEGYETSPFAIDEIKINNGGAVQTGATVGASTNQSTAISSSMLGALNVTGIYLSEIIRYLCEAAGLTASDIDISDILSHVSTGENRFIKGFIINGQGSARQSIEMLMATFQIEVAESQLKLVFSSRHYKVISGVVAVIPTGDLATRRDKDGNELQPLEITTTQEVEVPAEVVVKYLDADRDYSAVSQRAVRQFANSIQKAEINLPMALSSDQAMWAAVTNLLAAWAERKRYKLSIPAWYAKLDVGDIIQVDHSIQSHFMRIVKINFNQGIYEIEAVGQDITGIPANGTFATITAVAGDLGVAQGSALTGAAPPAITPAINYPVASHPVFIDTNMLSDDDDDAGFYALMDAGFVSGGYWPSGAILKSADNASWSLLLGFGLQAKIGIALTALADGTTTIFDAANSVDVQMTNGQLYSASELNVLNGSNIGIIGNEIFQWKTATLISTNTYRLSGLLRGRRGTEGNTTGHLAGERFILYSPPAIQRANGQLDEIGLSRFYKAVTTGLLLADQPYHNFTNTAKGLKPYNPVHIKAVRDGSNNITLTWIRRTRKGGAWRDYVDAALSEASELYDVEVKSGSTVLRTISGLSSATTGYTSAQQTADGITPGNPVTVNIYQISADVGRGYAGAATV